MINPERQFTFINQLTHHTPRQPFMVECFATWCGPCRQMAPHLAQLHAKYPKFFIVSVSSEDQDKVTEFVQNNPHCQKFNVAVDSQKKAAGLQQKYSVNGIPHAFIFDENCQVVWQGHPSEAEPEIVKVLKNSESAGFVGKSRVL
ncbi:FixW_protein [Hexamita inflata]|uniref:Putative n=1 Tax=Hexamita inflata TaxID=28002 RepID=A0AA86TL22_9EUKA|nr:FixW protein [Hexamita inflata]